MGGWEVWGAKRVVDLKSTSFSTTGGGIRDMTADVRVVRKSLASNGGPSSLGVENRK